MNNCSKCGNNFTPTQRIYYEDKCPNCEPKEEPKLFGEFSVVKGKGLYGRTYKQYNSSKYKWAEQMAKEEASKPI
jgi:hypothetical protein